MNWRIHLTNQAIRELHCVSGKSHLLAVWTKVSHVEFYDIETGALYGHREIAPPPDGDYLSDEWQAYLASLIDSTEQAFLPIVRTAKANIYTSDNGKLHVFHEPTHNLKLLKNSNLTELDTSQAESFLSLDLDRASGFMVALDAQGRLFVYRQDKLMGDFDIGLTVDLLSGAMVKISKGDDIIFASDGKQIVRLKKNGEIQDRAQVHYNIRQMACSPDGSMIVTSDNDAGLIRVYGGKNLRATHQRFAADLIAEAQQVQLMADLPPMSVAISALTAGKDGAIGFAMSGVICMTNVDNLTKLPRPQSQV